MQVDELLGVRPILEYGRRGFPGYGMHLFSQRHYEYMVGALNGVTDQQARTWLIEWLSEVFQRDNGKFSPRRFQQAVAARKDYGARPMFQQRHFYYLAQWIKEIGDRHIHDFVQDWLAQVAGGTNPAFKRDVWNRYCAPDEPRVDEAWGAPGFGSRSHGGFGQKIFARSHYLSIAAQLGGISDSVVKQHLTEWFGKLFKLDNPGFKLDAFENAALQWDGARHSARWQQRHFYFIAHEIAEIADPHERKFICDWFAQNIGSSNEYFNVERWEKYCNLDVQDWERRSVASRRAKAGTQEGVPAIP